MIFENEDQMRELLIKWLRNNGFTVRRGIYVRTLEIDIAAAAPIKITKEGLIHAKNSCIYAFEAKIATTYKLMKDIIEQAIIRLLAADYAYIVVPKAAEVWVNGKTKETIEPPIKVKKMASGAYSRNIGIISIGANGEVDVTRQARKSHFMIKELRNLILREIYRTKNEMI